MRELSFAEALSEGLVQAMEQDESIFVTGIAVDYPSGIFGSTVEATKRFGPERVFDAPAMENALMGIAIGAAAMGKRPVIVHPRADFMFLAYDQLINLAAKWSYMFGGNAGNCPVVVRAVIGRGWGQGATHSQSLQSTLAHFPGLTVAMPSFPDDAKAMTLAALQGSGPVVIFEHRSLYATTGPVGEEAKPAQLGKARIIRPGKDVTVVATSYMAYEAAHAAEQLAEEGVDIELIDLRTIRPLDEKTILESVRKTGRLVVADTSWELCGIASEVVALVSEKAFGALNAPPRRICLANCPAPVSKALEEKFYPRASTIADAVTQILRVKPGDRNAYDRVEMFEGPY